MDGMETTERYFVEELAKTTTVAELMEVMHKMCSKFEENSDVVSFNQINQMLVIVPLVLLWGEAEKKKAELAGNCEHKN